LTSGAHEVGLFVIGGFAGGAKNRKHYPLSSIVSPFDGNGIDVDGIRQLYPA
jgi:hypothetical protein